MTNAELHKIFVQIGRDRNGLTNKLKAMLPEINRRKIYRDYGCDSIYEYAGKFGGLSRAVVESVLKLEKKLEAMPELFGLVETEGSAKVALIANLATPENALQLADKVKNMSKRAVTELAKEMRGREAGSEKSPCQAVQKITIHLDEEMQFLFLKLKQKMGTSSNKRTMKEILQKMIKQEFPKIGEDFPGPACPVGRKKSSKIASGSEKLPDFAPTKKATPAQKSRTGETPKIPKNFAASKNVGTTKDLSTTETIKNRPISAQEKRTALEEYSYRCGYLGCNKPHSDFHHMQPFTRTYSHENIVPLCKEHHEFMHNGLATETWKFNLDGKIGFEDAIYRKKRRG